MAKIGPNQPCPCGSGKKYKKCCFIKDGRVASGPPTKPRSFDEMAEGSPYPPYVIARKAEEDFFGALRLPQERPVMRSDIEGLATEELLARLAEMGVQLTESEFVAAAGGQHSAWELSRRWRTHIPADRTRDHDFVALATCSLWERWCPDSPSMEMVDGWMQHGYVLRDKNRDVEAYEHWLHVWQVLREWIRPEMRTFHAAEEVFRGGELLFNWLQDVAMYLSEVAVMSPSVGKRGVAFLRECLAQFPDEKLSIRRTLRLDLAQALFALGERDEGRAMLDAMIVAEPRACGAYAVLADELAYHPATPGEVGEALRVLLRATEAKVVDSDDYDLEARLAHVRELLCDAGDAGGSTPGAVGRRGPPRER